MKNYDTLPSKKGKHNVILYRRFTYQYDGANVSGEVKYYRCTVRSCRGRGYLYVSSIPPVLSTFEERRDKEGQLNHNHAANKEDIQRRQTVVELKKAVEAQPDATICEIYTEVTARRRSDLGGIANAKSIPTLPEGNVLYIDVTL